jgi:hypothetical protein
MTLEDDGTLVRISLRRGRPPSKQAAARDPRAAFSTGEEVAEVVFRFHGTDGPELGSVRQASLSMNEGITPTALARFPWDKWLTAADAYARRRSTDELGEAIRQANRAAARPGRRGHPPSFFAGVAKRYDELRGDGERAPVAVIATEQKVSRNTAAGWVKRCRELGLLPPARPGRAG